MKAIYDGTYMSQSKLRPLLADGRKNITRKFRYKVVGTPDELAQFEAVQGVNNVISDEGDTLWFSRNYVGEQAELIFTQGEVQRIAVENSENAKLQSLVEQNGDSKIADALAQIAAQRLVAQVFAGKGVQAPTEPPVKTKETSKEEDLKSEMGG